MTDQSNGGTLDASDLVEAIGERARWRGAHPDLRDYWAGRCQILLVGLGAEAETETGDDRSQPNTSSVRWLLEAAALASVESASPFDGIFEASEPVMAIHRQFSRVLSDLGRRHREVNQAIALACLSALSPGIADRSCELSILAGAGLDPTPPDPDHYL